MRATPGAAQKGPKHTKAEADLARARQRQASEEEADQQWMQKWEANDRPKTSRTRVGVRAMVAERRLEEVRRAQQDRIDKHVSGPGRVPLPVDETRAVQKAKERLEKARADVAQHRRATLDRIADLEAMVAAEVGKPSRSHRASTDCRRNTTDPQSRAIPKRGGGWIQGYNCQAVVSSDGLILATDVVNDPIDAPYLVQMMNASIAAADQINAHRPAPWSPEPIGVLLADAGYHSEKNITATGCERLIPGVTSHKLTKDRADRAESGQPLPPEPDRQRAPLEHMNWRLQTDEGYALYKQRSHLAETPFGHAKHNLGFTRFTGRGLTRAKGEFAFHALVHNICKAISSGHLPQALA